MSKTEHIENTNAPQVSKFDRFDGAFEAGARDCEKVLDFIGNIVFLIWVCVCMVSWMRSDVRPIPPQHFAASSDDLRNGYVRDKFIDPRERNKIEYQLGGFLVAILFG